MTVHVSRVSTPYWLAIPEEERAAIEEAIPEGYTLHIKPGYHAKPGTADIELRDEQNRTVRGPVRGYLTALRCWGVLPMTGTGRGIVVRVDAAGWVTSVEDQPE